MKLNDLNHGDIVRLRTGRAGRERIEWSEWTEAALYIQKLANGQITLLTVDNGCWAEAGTSDLNCTDYDQTEGGVIMVEDYYLQISGLTP